LGGLLGLGRIVFHANAASKRVESLPAFGVPNETALLAPVRFILLAPRLGLRQAAELVSEFPGISHSPSIGFGVLVKFPQLLETVEVGVFFAVPQNRSLAKNLRKRKARNQ